MSVEMIQAIGDHIIVPICSVAVFIATFYFLSK